MATRIGNNKDESTKNGKTQKRRKPQRQGNPSILKRQPANSKPSWKYRSGPPSKQKKKKDKDKGGTVTPAKVANKKPDFRHSEAIGQRNNIMVTPIISPQAVLGYPIGVLIHAMIKGFVNSSTKPLYAAYTAMINDFLVKASGGTPPLKSRLRYINTLLHSIQPKEISFKQGTISYAWNGLDSVSAAPLYVVRNYNTAFYIKGNSSVDEWDIFIAPPVLPVEEAIPVYAEVMALLNNATRSCLTFEESAEYSDLTRDVSGYCGNSSYYGAGNTPALSGTLSSVELEVPFKSRMMGVFTGYNQADVKRVSRNLEITSGDSTSNCGFPFVEGIRDDFYRNAVPTIYCFIDLDEVCYYLQAWYIALVAKFRQNSNPDSNVHAIAPFTASAQQFRIAVRQCVLSYFADQASVQFLNYTSDPNGFEPFRCGTNCYPLQRVENQIRMPIALVENMRMLQTKSFCYNTTKYDVPRNRVIYKPVWGIYKAAVNAPPNVAGDLYTEGWDRMNLFAQDVSLNDPNPIDGFHNGTCLNLNSSRVDLLIAEWNARIDALSAHSTTTGILGSSTLGSLLPYCRFVNYFQTDERVSSYPPILRTTFHKEFIKKLPIRTETPAPVIATNDKYKVTKQVSVKEGYEEFYVPPFFSLYRQETQSFSSFYPITDTSVTILNQLILPSYFVEPTEPPTQQQIRVATMTPYVEIVANPSTGYKSRALVLDQVAAMSAPGIGASSNTDEFIATVKKMSELDQGGFLGDALLNAAGAAIGSLVHALPI